MGNQFTTEVHDVCVDCEIHKFIKNECKDLNNKKLMMHGKQITYVSFNEQQSSRTLIEVNGNYYYCNGTIKCDSLRTMFAIVRNEKAYFEDIEK